jgi:Flp pilus assembly protein TadD
MAQGAIQPDDAAGDARRMWIIGATAIVLMTLAAYWPVFNAGFIWDDDSYVTDNALVQSVDGLGKIWIPRQTPQYYPAVFTSFWIEHQLWGLNPLGYHIVNVLLHALNAILVWRLCVMLKIPGAWLIGAVFAVHPINVESVAWITERKNVLSGAFYLLAAIQYLKFDDSFRDGREAASDFRRWLHYALSLVLFVLALLSKTVTCSLPAALILMMLWQRKRITIARVLPLVPMFVVGFALAMHTLHLEEVHVGTWGPDFDLTLGQRLMIAVQAVWFYPMKIIAPWPLMFIYPRWDIASWSMSSIAMLAGAGMLLVGCIAMFVRGSRGVPLAMAFYAGTIFPALGFFNIYPMRFSFVADHFAYLASLGVITAIIGPLATIVVQRRLAAVMSATVVLGLVTISHLRCTAYENEETLWRWTVQQNPLAWIAHNNLGRIVLMQGDAATAADHFQRAVDMRPDLDDLRSNLANAFRLAGRPEDALTEYRRIESHRPLMATDQSRLAQVLADLGRADEADAAFVQALAHPQNTEDVRVLYGVFLSANGRSEEAAAQFRSFLEAHPEDGFVHLMLGDALRNLGRIGESAAAWRQASEIAKRTGDSELTQQVRMRFDRASPKSDADR